MQASTDLKKILNPQGDVAERIIPGLVGFESYFEHIEKYMLGARIADRQGVVVDLACGSGYGSYYLARQGFRQVVGIDRAEAVVAYAEDTYANRVSNLSFVPGDATDIPLPTSCIDVFVSFETIEHVADPDQFLQETDRVLRPGGVLILSTPNKHRSKLRGESNPYHISELFIEEVYEKLDSVKFEITQMFGQGASAHKGAETLKGTNSAWAKSMMKSVLPDFAAQFLRQRVLLPRRTGIPAQVIAWNRSAPTRFEDWVAENPIRTRYRPKALHPLAFNEFRDVYNTFIVVAQKGR